MSVDVSAGGWSMRAVQLTRHEQAPIDQEHAVQQLLSNNITPAVMSMHSPKHRERE